MFSYLAGSIPNISVNPLKVFGYIYYIIDIRMYITQNITIIAHEKALPGLGPPSSPPSLDLLIARTIMPKTASIQNIPTLNPRAPPGTKYPLKPSLPPYLICS